MGMSFSLAPQYSDKCTDIPSFMTDIKSFNFLLYLGYSFSSNDFISLNWFFSLEEKIINELSLLEKRMEEVCAENSIIFGVEYK